MSARFADRVAIVTGASRGIGREIALTLAREGAMVALVARSEERLATLEREITAAGGRATCIVADIADRDQAVRVVAEAERLGKPAILVNNAGITRDALLLRMRPEDWNEVMAVDLNAVFHLTQAVLKPMLRARYGRIVTITSVVGL